MGLTKSKKEGERGILDHPRKLELLYALTNCTRGPLALLIKMWDKMPEGERQNLHTGNDHKLRADALRKYHKRLGGSDPRGGDTGRDYLKLVESTLKQLGWVQDNLQAFFIDSSYEDFSAQVPSRTINSSYSVRRLVDQNHREPGVISMKFARSRRPPSIEEMWERGQVDQLLVYYTEDAAKNWQTVTKNKMYAQFDQCEEALKLLLKSEKWSDFCQKKHPDGIVSLGAGSASKDLIILDGLRKHNDAPLTFTLVDYSPPMLEDTATQIEEGLDERGIQNSIELIPLRADFMELQPYRSIRRHGTPVIFFIAGGTIGNVNESELLRAIERCSEPGDWFIVGLETIPEGTEKSSEVKAKFENELLKKYNQPYARKLLAPALERIWKKLGHTKPFKDKSFEAVVAENIVPRPAWGRGKAFSTVSKSMSIVFEVIGDENPITLLASTRYDEEEFLKFVSEFGFIKAEATTSKENPKYRMLALEYAPRSTNL
ncbi:MAG: L-histidine N(alpha)-methyltransferase [Chloroflexi bacterium]|nr:L-histidine N(alpha)-methyltransferase [Chloroflexota bacterium]